MDAVNVKNYAAGAIAPDSAGSEAAGRTFAQTKVSDGTEAAGAARSGSAGKAGEAVGQQQETGTQDLRSRALEREQLQNRDIVSTDVDGDTVAVSRETEDERAAARDGAVKVTGADEKETSSDRKPQNIETKEPSAAAKRAAEAVDAEREKSRLRQEAAREEALAEAEAAREERIAALEQENPAAAVAEGEEKITDFTGITNQQLKTYYLQGKVSQNDYNTEMEARAARTESEQAENAELMKDTAALQQIAEDTKRTMEAAASANAEKGRDGLRGNERLDAAENAVKGANETASVAATGSVTVRTDRTAAEKAASEATKQSTDALLRGEERIQWDYQ